MRWPECSGKQKSVLVCFGFPDYYLFIETLHLSAVTVGSGNFQPRTIWLSSHQWKQFLIQWCSACKCGILARGFVYSQNPKKTNK